MFRYSCLYGQLVAADEFLSNYTYELVCERKITAGGSMLPHRPLEDLRCVDRI
jgi:hypothetical protein